MTALSGQRTEVLVFRHFYDNVWGIVRRPRYSFGIPTLIMPQGFQPRIGEKYECIISPTDGVFVLDEKEHRLCFAVLANEASVIDIVDYQFQEKESLGSPITTALSRTQGVQERIRELPAQHEQVVLEVVHDIKNGGLMFNPQYVVEEKAIGNIPSMRFFHIDRKDAYLLCLGQKWRTRIKRVRPTQKQNKRGIRIVNVDVILIQQLERRSLDEVSRKRL